MGAAFFSTNLADSATLTTTTSGSMLRPLDDLKKAWARGLARGPANGTGSIPAELVIRADLGSNKTIGIVGLFGLNDAVATGEIRLSLTAFGNTDAGTAIIGNSGSFGQTHGNAAVWRGSSTCRYIEIYLQVFSLPSGFRHVDARRLFIGQSEGSGTVAATLSDGVDFDWSLETIDLSGSTTTARGGIFVSAQGSYRRLTFGVTGMTLAESESLQTWIARTRGKQEILAVLRDYGAFYEELSDNTIYGRLLEWSPIQHTGGDTYACERIVVQEVPYPAL